MIKIKKNAFNIVTIIQRYDQVNRELTYEYVGLTDNGNDTYFSHGLDYFCQLSKLQDHEVKYTNEDTLKFGKYNYSSESVASNTVMYAEGFDF